MLGKIEGRRRRGQQRLRCLASIASSMDVNFCKLWEVVKDRGARCAAAGEVTNTVQLLNNGNSCFTMLC